MMRSAPWVEVAVTNALLSPEPSSIVVRGKRKLPAVPSTVSVVPNADAPRMFRAFRPDGEYMMGAQSVPSTNRSVTAIKIKPAELPFESSIVNVVAVNTLLTDIGPKMPPAKPSLPMLTVSLSIIVTADEVAQTLTRSGRSKSPALFVSVNEVLRAVFTTVNELPPTPPRTTRSSTLLYTTTPPAYATIVGPMPNDRGAPFK